MPRVLLILLLFALLVRLGWGWRQPTDRRGIAKLPDQAEYLAIGRNLLAGKGFHFFDERYKEDVHAYRTPGYPLFIAAFGANVRIVRVAQAVVDTSTVLAIFLLARRWLDEQRSLIAAALVAVNPFLIYFSGLLLSETLFTAMLAWGMVLLVQSKRPFLGAILLVLSIYVRPSVLGLTLLLGWSAALATQNALAMRWVGLRILVVTAIALLPWAARNKGLLNEWVWTTTNGGITLLDGFNPDADGSSKQEVIFKRYSNTYLTALGEVGRDELFRSEARRYMREHPAECVELAIKKIARTWSPMPLSSDFQKKAYVAAGLLFSIPFMLLCVIGLFTARLPRSARWLLILPALYITAVHAMSVGSLRYRIPAEAPMAVIAAAAVPTFGRKPILTEK